jgi:hypothetical protein
MKMDAHNNPQDVNMHGTPEAEAAVSSSEEPMALSTQLPDNVHPPPALSEAELLAIQAEANLEEFRNRQNRKEECVICTDDVAISELEELPCMHFVCRHSCLPQYVENAIQFQALYPPRCCEQTIPMDSYAHLLPNDLLERFVNKMEEYHTDPRLRRYCAEDKMFLPPASYEDIGENNEMTVARCRTCSKTTCILCTELVGLANGGEQTGADGSKIEKRKSPFSHDCKPKELEKNAEYSKDTRFKGCPFCGRLGLLENACNHVTCGCGGEYCFICLEPWNYGEGHGDCNQYNDPIYDEEGYDSKGFHRDTGIDREGYTRAGYNIRGLNRQGQRMKGFANREFGNQHTQRRNQIEDVLDGLDDDAWEEAAAMELVLAMQNGGDVQEVADRLGFDIRDEDSEDIEDDQRDRDDQVAQGEGDIEAAQGGFEGEQEHPGWDGPSSVQISCIHAFDFDYGVAFCHACHRETTEGFSYLCPQCDVRICGQCYQIFEANGQLNWPESAQAAENSSTS